MEEKKRKMRRVGTLSAGIILVALGILFVLHLFVPSISYLMIFRTWPCVLILLGLEMLAATRRQEEVIYDTGAVILAIFLAVFAMGMAGADLLIQYGIREGAMVYFS